MHSERTSLRHWILVVLVVCGLFFAGTGHAGLHGDDHGADCPACFLVGDTPPEPVHALAPALPATVRLVVLAQAPPRVLPRRSAAPRGPPAVC